jgi:choline dehydrogenase-like flavoprotein
VEANIAPDCLGCGYCNMGCPFGKKHSMLDTVLPWAQRDHGERLQVLPGFRAERVIHEGGRAVGVLGRHEGGEPVTLAADKVVVAAGAVGSSWLLQRSGIAQGRAGQALFFNVNSPLTADFPDPVRTYAGLQMSHAYLPDGPGREQPYVLETWFNPPATQALAMPGWFSDHYENMRRYAHMVCGGVLVGTTTPASVTADRDEPEIVYTPSREDLRRVVEGLKLMGRIFFAAGATRILPATYAWHEMRTEAALDELDVYVRDNADLLLTTAHPQGGNPIGDPADGGVVGADFRVHGFANLWVADASVFPSSVGVNPQLTVMALARCAADAIAAA